MDREVAQGLWGGRPIRGVLKPEGTLGSFLRSESLPAWHTGQACAGPVRQFHGGGLHQPSGGDQVLGPPEGGVSHAPLGRGQSGLPEGGPHTRRTQLSGGPAEQAEAGPQGVGFVPGRVPQRLRSVGYAGGGLVRVTTQCQAGEVLFDPALPTGGGAGCAGSPLGFSPGLCVSSDLPASAGVGKDPVGGGESTSHCPLLAQESLVYAADPSGGGAPSFPATKGGLAVSGGVPAPGPGSTEPGGLDPEREALLSRGLSEAVVATLLNSRKLVTRRIYAKVWKVYRSWTAESGKDFSLLSSVLDFLQRGLDRNLALSTLKVQVAALSACMDQPWASHPLVKRFFSAVGRRKPVAVLTTPPWDLSLVLAALMRPPFEPLEEGSLKFLTWKTAFLVAITSARRVSELQALSIKSPYLTVFPDKVVLRVDPSFLPKVASDFHRSQEVVLPSFCNNPANDKERAFGTLDVRRCLLHYLEVSKEFRKSSALFVLRGGVNRGRQASKSSIARWIRQAIGFAYSSQGKSCPSVLKAHSTRSVASSWAERAGASLEQICRAATWSSHHTFIRHYRVDLLSSQDLAFGRKVLQAVVPP